MKPSAAADRARSGIAAISETTIRIAGTIGRRRETHGPDLGARSRCPPVGAKTRRPSIATADRSASRENSVTPHPPTRDIDQELDKVTILCVRPGVNPPGLRADQNLVV